MSDVKVYLQPAFVLHAQKYRESSLILDVLTEDFGRMSLLAKGIKKPKARAAAILQPFIPLRVSFTGRSELKTLTQSELLRAYQPLQGMALYCGFYINELLQNFLFKHDPHPEIFAAYERCLASLGENGDLELPLRIFEIALLRYSGYGLQLDYAVNSGAPIDAEKRYGYYAEHGAVEDDCGAFSGKTLLALRTNNLIEAEPAETKKLLRLVIAHHLHKPLKSRAFIAQLIRHPGFCTETVEL